MSLRREFTTLLADRVAPLLAEQGFAPALRGGFLCQSLTDEDAFIGVSPLISKRSTTARLLYTFDVGLWFPRIAAVLGSPAGQADEPESWHAKCRSTDSPASQERGDFERASWYSFDGPSPESLAEWDLARDDLDWALGQVLPLASESSIEAFWGSGSYNGQTDAEHQAYLRAVRRVLGH